MEILLLIYLIIFIILCIIAYWIIQVPIMIAKNRGICGSELSTIRILSWCGLIVGITWIIAIILSIVWKPNNWVEKTTPAETIMPKDNLETLEKLSALKDKGIITDAEFQREKQKIMSNL